MFYIYQKTGERAEIAHRIWQAEKDGDRDLAVSLYTSIMEDGSHVDPASLPPSGLWWLCNAPRAVRMHAPRAFVAVVEKYPDWNSYSRRMVYAEAREAERIYGGVWEVQYEY